MTIGWIATTVSKPSGLPGLVRFNQNSNREPEANPQSPLDCPVAVVHLMHCERRLVKEYKCLPATMFQEQCKCCENEK
jgi:hypothetical protein